MLLGGALVAGGAGVWMLAVGRQPSDDRITRVLCAGLGVALIGVAGKKFFWDLPRSRHPRWQRTSTVLVLLWAGYMLVLAIRGV
jgi:hypothetical protein